MESDVSYQQIGSIGPLETLEVRPEVNLRVEVAGCCGAAAPSVVLVTLFPFVCLEEEVNETLAREEVKRCLTLTG